MPSLTRLVRVNFLQFTIYEAVGMRKCHTSHWYTFRDDKKNEKRPLKIFHTCPEGILLPEINLTSLKLLLTRKLSLVSIQAFNKRIKYYLLHNQHLNHYLKIKRLFYWCVSIISRQICLINDTKYRKDIEIYSWKRQAISQIPANICVRPSD